jgi:RimJ/RimL family protein N-acetyltransferase
MEFKTERCLVRGFEEQDLGAFAAYRNDLSWMRYQGFKGLTEAEYRAALLGRHSTEDGVQLAIVLTASGQLIGDLYLKREAGNDWIGYSVSPRYAGQGYAREAVRGLIARLGEQGAERISASTLPENTASRSLLKKLGFAFAGTDTNGEELYTLELRSEK